MKYIGSAPENDIVLTGKYISERHARLTINKGIITIEDLDSTFGTFVNGNRISKPTILKGSDRVKIGTHHFHWHDYLGMDITKDENPIYLKDLFSPIGKISWSTYKYVLLISLAAIIIIPLGVPTLLSFLQYYPGRGNLIRDLNLTPYGEAISWIIAAIAFYIFINLTVKAIRNQIS